MLSPADLTTHSSKSSSTHKWLMLYSQPTTRFAMGSKTSSQSSDCIKRCTTPATARDTSSSQDQSCRKAAHCAPAPHSTYYKKEIYNCGPAFIRRLMKQLHSASARTTNIGRHIKNPHAGQTDNLVSWCVMVGNLAFSSCPSSILRRSRCKD